MKHICHGIGETDYFPTGDHAWHRANPWGLYAWDPRLKLLLLGTAVGLNVGLARLWLSGTLFMTGMILLLASRVPLKKFFLFFLAPAWATLVVFLGFSIGFGQTPLHSFGPITMYREGVVLGVSAAARVACDMTWMAAVFLTTPFNNVLAALKWYRLPDVLVDTMAMAYRYAFLLYHEFVRMQEAATARGGMKDYRSSMRCTASILSQIILRAYDRSRAIQEAMINRGAFTESIEDVSPMEQQYECPNQCDITPVPTTEHQPVLRLKNISFFHGRSQSIKNITLTVQKKEILVLCGPNGAGKTTLLRLASGILVPQAGTIYLGNILLDRRHRKQAFRHVGFLSQDPNDQLFCTHVWEDIAYGPTRLGHSPEAIQRRVKKAMELMEVAHLAHRPIHMLSFGEMKRVGLAGIIAMQPPLILMDEPTAGLDPASAKHLVSLIRHLNDHHGYTLVIVSHDINMAAQIAKRIAIINEGRLMADGRAHSILQNETLLEQSRLESPILTRLFRMIQRQGLLSATRIPVTVEEAVDRLGEMICTGGEINRNNHHIRFCSSRNTALKNRKG
jgi:cobalt/nickel transport system ATP-binding protein